MSTGAGVSSGNMITAPSDRMLSRKGSKSRLEKQHGVESEEPPAAGHGTTSQRDQQRSRVIETASAGVHHGSFEKEASTDTCLETRTPKLQIPETRVESFDAVDDNNEDKNISIRPKILTRSHAMCGDDDTKLNARRLQQQSSKGSGGSSLSRDSSNELYTDSTGINLEQFIINTLHKNPRDRMFLLELEETLMQFLHDTGKQIHRFPVMSSYNRMLIHRVAAFFGLDHNVDQTGVCVVISKMDTTRMPEMPFRSYIKNDIYTDQRKKASLKRDAQSYEEAQTPALGQHPDIRKARSFDEREENDGNGKGRVFGQQDSSSSMEGVMESSVRPWSSTDSSSDQSQTSFMQLKRVQLMQHAGTFGPALCPTDSTKLSPRRTITESTRETGSFVRQTPGGKMPVVIPPGQPVLFAVTSIDQVPPGAVIVNPQTGQPYVNADGTVYRHGPPVPVYRPPSPHTAVYVPQDQHWQSQLASQLQQLNIYPSGHSPHQTYWSAPSQIYAYVMQNQQQLHVDPVESNQKYFAATVSPQPLFQHNSPQPMLSPIHAAPVACPEAPSQQTAAMANTAAGFPIYYPSHISAVPAGAGVSMMTSPVQWNQQSTCSLGELASTGDPSTLVGSMTIASPIPISSSAGGSSPRMGPGGP